MASRGLALAGTFVNHSRCLCVGASLSVSACMNGAVSSSPKALFLVLNPLCEMQIVAASNLRAGQEIFNTYGERPLVPDNYVVICNCARV